MVIPGGEPSEVLTKKIFVFNSFDSIVSAEPINKIQISCDRVDNVSKVNKNDFVIPRLAIIRKSQGGERPYPHSRVSPYMRASPPSCRSVRRRRPSEDHRSHDLQKMSLAPNRNLKHGTSIHLSSFPSNNISLRMRR